MSCPFFVDKMMMNKKADELPMKIDKSAKDESQVRTNSKTAMKAKLPTVKQKAFKAKQ